MGGCGWGGGCIKKEIINPLLEIRVTLPAQGYDTFRSSAMSVPINECGIFVCPNNALAASVRHF